MNELTCNSICQLLCCPPVPSKIAAKLAFMPPPASYQLSPTESDGQCSFAFSPFLKHSFLHILPNNIEVTKAKTRKGNTIAILYMKTNPNTKLTFLLSHGNAVDLGLMVNFMHELGTKLNVNMMCYDYSGYGASSGKPLEKNLYADAECALDVLRTKFAVPLDQIVLYGQSIGTVPTVHLATLHRVAAVVLHSPLMSGLRVAFPRLKRNYCCDVFSNLARAPRILSPTLVIHGTRDEVVHINHGYRICSALAENVLLDPLFIDGAGHNDCEMFPQYLLRLIKLVTIEIPRLRSKSAIGCANKSPKSLKCDVHSSPSEMNSPEEDDTDISISSSHKLTEEFCKASPVSSKRSSPITRSSGRRISPVVVENLRALLLKRGSVNKRSPASVVHVETNDLSGDTRFDPKPVVPSKAISSSETNVSSLMCTELRSSKPTHMSCSKSVPVVTNMGRTESNMVVQTHVYTETETNPEKVVQNTDPKSISPSSKTHTLADQNDSLDELVLPPPPPPPPASLLDNFPASQEVLWSLHATKGRKNLTLPQNFNLRRILTSDWAKLKTETLPREFRQFPSENSKPSVKSDVITSSENNSNALTSLSSSTLSTSSESSDSAPLSATKRASDTSEEAPVALAEVNVATENKTLS